MSRIDDSDGDGPMITAEMWAHNVAAALNGRRGQRMLAEMRAALLALPDRRLIGRALCTVGKVPGRYDADDFAALVDGQGGPGVCAVGAYAWYRKVRAGMDPTAAFESLPLLADYESSDWETKMAGVEAGLSRTLAWEFAYLNDETLERDTPEERWLHVLDWVDAHLIAPPTPSSPATSSPSPTPTSTTSPPASATPTPPLAPSPSP